MTKARKVYIIVGDYWDDTYIVSVFGSRNKATAEVTRLMGRSEEDKLIEDGSTRWEYNIRERVVY